MGLVWSLVWLFSLLLIAFCGYFCSFCVVCFSLLVNLCVCDVACGIGFVFVYVVGLLEVVFWCIWLDACLLLVSRLACVCYEFLDLLFLCGVVG